MFFIYTGCVLQLLLYKNDAIMTEQMPPKLLEMSLKHVNTLLADIDDKIVFERQLISRIDNETGKDAVKNEAMFHAEIKPHFEKASEATLTVYQRGLVAHESDFKTTASVNQAARQLIELWKMAKIGRTVPELIQPDPFDDAEFTTSTTTTKAVNKLDSTPIKQVMLRYMETHNFSYCLGATYGAFEATHGKTNEEIEIFDEALADTVWRMGREGKLDCLDTLLKNRLMQVATWAMLIAPTYVRRFLYNVHVALEERNLLDPPEEKVILTYDSLFTDEEGDRLLDSVVIISAKRMKDKEIARALCEDFLTNFLAPVNRLCGTFQLKALINEINVGYSKYYPLSKRSGRKAFIDSLIENNSTSNKLLRRFMCEDRKDIKCDYRKNVHLILKFPTLFEDILTHPKGYSADRRSHQSKLKEYTLEVSEGLPHGQTHSMELFERNNKMKKTHEISKNWNHPEGSFQYPESRSLNIPNEDLKSFINVQKPITKFKNNKPDRLLTSFKERSIYNNVGKYSMVGIQNFEKQSTALKKNHSKTVLDQIIEESSYSDEEMYLRVMLKDAFFHGNNITHWFA